MSTLCDGFLLYQEIPSQNVFDTYYCILRRYIFVTQLFGLNVVVMIIIIISIYCKDNEHKMFKV